MCDEEMTGTGPVYGPTATARRLYVEYTDNHPTIHSNRVPDLERAVGRSERRVVQKSCGALTARQGV